MESTPSTLEESTQPGLKSLDITASLINAEAVQNLSNAIRPNSDGSSVPFNIPANTEFLLPFFAEAVSSGVAFEPKKVSIKDLKKLRPEVNAFAWLISRFSPKLAYKFDRSAQNKATDIVTDATARTVDIIEILGRAENPRAQFLQEIEKLYKELPNFNEYPGLDRRPLSNLTTLLDNVNKLPKDHWFKKNYPLITKT